VTDLALFDISSLSFVRRANAAWDRGVDIATAAHACDVADAARDAACADLAAEYGRYVVDFEVSL